MRQRMEKGKEQKLLTSQTWILWWCFLAVGIVLVWVLGWFGGSAFTGLSHPKALAE